jgi:hypothetical protein
MLNCLVSLITSSHAAKLGASKAGSPKGLAMHGFDYGAGAELFTNTSNWSRRAPAGYKRFARAADAIRFAIEGLPANTLASAWLEVGDDRFNAADIHRLYEDDAYPLDRREPVTTTSAEQGTASSENSPGARKPPWWSRS